MQLAEPAARHGARDRIHEQRELLHFGLIARDETVEQLDRTILLDRDGRGPAAPAKLRDAVAHRVRWVVVLERRLDREGLHARIRREHAVDVAWREPAAERHAADPNDGIDRDAGLALECIEPFEGHERKQHRR